MSESTRLVAADLRARAPQWRSTPEVERALRDAAPAGWSVRIVEAPTVSDGDGGTPPSEAALDAIRDAEVYFGFGISQALFAAATRLRWVHSAAAGVGGALFPAMRESDVILTNSAGVHADPMAETVLGGLLWFLRGLDVAREAQRAGRWDRALFTGESSPMREVGDCRVLIYGAGGIGRAIATRLTALGAECIGVRRRVELGAPDGFARVVGVDAWRDELPRADVLVIAAPATEETRDLVGAAELDRLPSGAIVVNVARGTLLDEAALVERLRSGALRGAVLDVFRHEPLNADSPLWTQPNVLMTPHVSAVAPRGFWRRELELFIDNWRRYVAGEPMRNVVDKQAGY